VAFWDYDWPVIIVRGGSMGQRVAISQLPLHAYHLPSVSHSHILTFSHSQLLTLLLSTSSTAELTLNAEDVNGLARRGQSVNDLKSWSWVSLHFLGRLWRTCPYWRSSHHVGVSQDGVERNQCNIQFWQILLCQLSKAA